LKTRLNYFLILTGCNKTVIFSTQILNIVSKKSSQLVTPAEPSSLVKRSLVTTKLNSYCNRGSPICRWKRSPADCHHVFVCGKLTQHLTSSFDFQEDHLDNPVSYSTEYYLSPIKSRLSLAMLWCLGRLRLICLQAQRSGRHKVSQRKELRNGHQLLHMFGMQNKMNKNNVTFCNSLETSSHLQSSLTQLL